MVLEEFPDTCFSYLLGFLRNPSDLAQLQACSRHLRTLASDNALWGPILFDRFDILVDVSFLVW